MSQAVAKPEDMERFARELKQFNAQLASSMKRLNGQFARLGGTWRDQEHQKFAQDSQPCSLRGTDETFRQAGRRLGCTANVSRCIGCCELPPCHSSPHRLMTLMAACVVVPLGHSTRST
jgi:hypothetical protein